MEQIKNYNSSGNMANLITSNNVTGKTSKKNNESNNNNYNTTNSLNFFPNQIINSNLKTPTSLKSKKNIKNKNNLLNGIKNSSNALEIPIEFNINGGNNNLNNIQSQNSKENENLDNFRSYISILLKNVNKNY